MAIFSLATSICGLGQLAVSDACVSRERLFCLDLDAMPLSGPRVPERSVESSRRIGATGGQVAVLHLPRDYHMFISTVKSGKSIEGGRGVWLRIMSTQKTSSQACERIALGPITRTSLKEGDECIQQDFTDGF